MKSLTSKMAKFSVLAMFIGLAAGCASVTDATLPDSAQPAEIEQITQPAQPGPVLMGGNEIEPVMDRPDI